MSEDEKKEPKRKDEGQVQSIVAAPKSAALDRLIAEVRNSDEPNLSGYNRTYHRHNR